MTNPITYNQHPEQQARDIIDKKLEQTGWTIQSVKHFNPNNSLGVAVREYPTDSGPVDYLLFVDREPVAIIEAKEEMTKSHYYAIGVTSLIVIGIVVLWLTLRNKFDIFKKNS